jgi:protoporphyrinogen oxidase/glycosyltransferase involved in cell wall biosynthesis/beta-glucosidase/6-phospho-beta-glucosidase/beta-galactosidase
MTPESSSPAASPFSSFWQAGYEGADHVNRHGHALDMNTANGHATRGRDDYLLLREFGVTTVRESIGWRLAEKDGAFDFSHIEERARAGEELGLQICWTFCHYGWPDDVDVHAGDFVARFVRYVEAAMRFLQPYGGDAPVYSPVNEISFTSWGLSVGMFRCSPWEEEHRGLQAKRQLVRAAIAGCDAIWAITPGARMLHCDPLIHILAPDGQPEWIEEAGNARNAQFAAWDMLCGRLEPELGGAPRYLDLIGGNYYDTNQWEAGTGARLWWHLGDPRRMRLHRILVELHERYGRPLLLAETGHVGSGRGAWVREIACEAAIAAQQGADVRGVCLYPIIDRPDWENADHWHHSGLWDVLATDADPQARVLAPAYAQALKQAQDWTAHLSATSIDSITTTTTGATRRHKGRAMKTMIVFCHLRWDFVFQRPQHLMTQLARHYKIVFVEEPVHQAGPSGWSIDHPAPNLSVYRPHTPVDAPGFHDEQIAVLLPMVADLVADGEEPIVWFYTPMALPLLQAVTPALVVYDCMDELAAFKNSPKQLLQREAALLKVADLVFTGGPSLYESKRERHARAYCFPSSVDAVHFEQALDRANRHPLQDGLPSPRLGFYGVLDERLDAGLVGALADAHPEWQIVMVGPVVKIDPASLPRRANIHYLGQQPYQALPQFLAGWDVCLMPFALNESTRFISPTKVLEYMAAELPIVSTAIRDVEAPYGEIVAIGHTPQEFIAACEKALAMPAAARLAMQDRMREVVAATSWTNTVARMRELIDTEIAAGATTTVPLAAADAAASPAAAATANYAAPATYANASVSTSIAGTSVSALTPAANAENVSCIIVGAGPTGLSAAYHLGADTLLLERNATVGGWCRSIQEAGFTFDYAGHIMFSNDPYVLKLYDILLGDNQHWQMREAWVYSKQVFTRYPFQGALYGLPPDVIKECIVGAVEARYETPTTTYAAGGPNFEEFIYKVWGAGIARHFAIPYNKKLWTVPLDQMETSWLGGRVPLPNLAEIIDGALQPVGKPMGPNARFGYPLRGGFQALVSGFLPHIRGRIELNADVVELLPDEHTLALADGRRFHYDKLVSTMPLPELLRLIGDAAPEEVREAARGLKHISIRCVNIGVNRPNITDKHWIYYPEDSIFHRIFVQGNASPECNAPGGFGFTCEISYSPWKPLPVDGAELIARCIEDCIKVGMINADDEILTAGEVDMPYAYVVYDHARAQNVATVRAWLERHDIILSGRYSEWEYYNSDHAFLAGKKAAETVMGDQAAPVAATVV